jgi:hypothetical protein
MARRLTLETLIAEYLLSRGYELIEETPDGGMWRKPDSPSNMCSFEWAIKDCLARESWFGQLEDFLAGAR